METIGEKKASHMVKAAVDKLPEAGQGVGSHLSTVSLCSES